MKYQYRVRYKHQTTRARNRRYDHLRAAQEFKAFLTTPNDIQSSLYDWVGQLEYVRIERREVGDWERMEVMA